MPQRRLFVKIGDGPWKDETEKARYLMTKYGMDEANLLSEMKVLYEFIEPQVQLEFRDDPEAGTTTP